MTEPEVGTGQNRDAEQACERNSAIADSNGPETDSGLDLASGSSTKLQMTRLLCRLRWLNLIAILRSGCTEKTISAIIAERELREPLQRTFPGIGF
jgi:hypothetical protein